MPSILARIGRYEIKGRIGGGGMGTLYLALDTNPKLSRLVAVKLLRANLDSEDLRRRFELEAQALAQLNHTNIVNIYDSGEHDEAPYIVMEFIRGETLAEIIARRADLGLGQKLDLLAELCDGLSSAHDAGFIHRDIKPANLIVDRSGTLKILDFGIARSDDLRQTMFGGPLTQLNMQIGTPGYMSPEQVEGLNIDARSDVFAVGAVAYELISYRQAFRGQTARQMEHSVLNDQPAPLALGMPEIEPDLTRVLLSALEKDPARRCPDAATLGREFGRARALLGADAVDQEATPARKAGYEHKPRNERNADAAFEMALRARDNENWELAKRAALEVLAEVPSHQQARQLLQDLGKFKDVEPWLLSTASAETAIRPTPVGREVATTPAPAQPTPVAPEATAALLATPPVAPPEPLSRTPPGHRQPRSTPKPTVSTPSPEALSAAPEPTLTPPPAVSIQTESATIPRPRASNAPEPTRTPLSVETEEPTLIAPPPARATPVAALTPPPPPAFAPETTLTPPPPPPRAFQLPAEPPELPVRPPDPVQVLRPEPEPPSSTVSGLPETPLPIPERDRPRVIPPRPVGDRRRLSTWIVPVGIAVLAIVIVGSVVWMTGGPPPQPQPQVFQFEVERPSGGTIRIGDKVCGVDPDGCRQTFPLGHQVELRAEAAPDYEFRSFTGDCASDLVTLRKTITADMKCSAAFTRKAAPPPPGSYTLAIRSQVGGVVEGDGFTCRSTGGDCTKDVVERTAVTLQAKPDPAFRFDGWRGGCAAKNTVSKATTLRITVNQNVDCVATFSSTVPTPGPETPTPKPSVTPVASTTPVASPGPPPPPVMHTLTFNLADHGSLQIPGRLNCGKSGTDCDVQAPAGTQLTIQVTAEPDYILQQSSCGEWSNDRITLRLDTSRTCSVTFMRDPSKVALPSKTPVVTPGPTPAEIARPQIDDLITRYAKAMASRNTDEIAALYESYGGTDRAATRLLFDSYSSIQWNRKGTATIELSPDGRQAKAVVSGTKTLAPRRAPNNPTTSALSAEFQLVLTPTGWRIRTVKLLD